MSTLHVHVVHPHIEHRNAHGPVKVADQHPTGTALTRFNTRLALFITKVVGSMWCAYAFGLLDLVSLPAAIRGGTATIISWIAQTFLQLVLLSIIMVGQKVAAEASDQQMEQTYKDAEALLQISDSIHKLLQQNTEMTEQMNKLICHSDQK